MTNLRPLNGSDDPLADQVYDKPIDIDEQKVKWEKNWGKEVADRMEELVRGAMEDYEYLLQYSL